MQALILLMLAALGQPPGAQLPPQPAAEARSGLSIAGIAFSPADIANAEQTFDGDSAMPSVTVTFSESGRVKFRQAQEGRPEQPLDISVDGELVSSPILMEIITGNQVTISSGGFTVETARALARRIAPPR